MASFNLALDREAPLSLQDQLRRGIVDAIYAGVLRPGGKLPASRALARQLGVSRNTVLLAYGDLIAQGQLAARDRAGVFVAAKAQGGRVAGRRTRAPATSPVLARMADVAADDGARCPQHWRQYPYPFWDGRIDASLVPLHEWRKAVRLAACPRDTAQWSDGNGELDDAMLVEEIRTKLLPERAISALSEEVLVLASVRQALRFLLMLLVRPGTPVWLEAPVDPELLASLCDAGARVEQLQAVGRSEAVPAGVVVVTSARSGIASGARPTARLVAAVARAGGVVIEQDTPADTLESGAGGPALYAGAAHANVVYVGRLSPAVAAGTPLAIVVAAAPVIARLRRLRRIQGAVPEPLLQRSWAYFIALGYYAAALQKARCTLLARRTALRDALNHYLHAAVQITTVPGSSAYWVRCRDGQDAQVLAARAAAAGVLIQPARLVGARDAFVLGTTGIALARIREGVRALARVVHAQRAPAAPAAPGRILTGATLRRALAGKTFIYNTVYGEPCTIRIGRSGELVGMAGYANDDPDRGRWWIDADRWYRQWGHWAYGEAEGFAVAVEGDQLFWYDVAGNLVDRAVILPGRERAPAAGR